MSTTPRHSEEYPTAGHAWWKAVPARSGCYAFTEAGNVAYVGTATCLRCRIYSHYAAGRRADTVRIWFTPPTLEQRLIDHFNPPLNRALKGGGHSMQHREVKP